MKFRLYQSHPGVYQIQEWVNLPPTTFVSGVVVNEGTWYWKTHKIITDSDETSAIQEFEKRVQGIREARRFEPQVLIERTYKDEI